MRCSVKRCTADPGSLKTPCLRRSRFCSAPARDAPRPGHAAASGNHAHDVGLLHDQEILTVELDLGARPLAEQHVVAGLQLDRNNLAGLVAAAGADGDHFAFGRLFLDGIGNDDAALGLGLGVDTLDDHPVMQRPELELRHCSPSSPPLKRHWRWTKSCCFTVY